MTMAMTMGSLFDGSGGFPLAGAMCGMKPIWAAEVEPYPIAVTRSRFPQMRHLGSVTEIDGGKIPPVDVITGGSPCQNLSIAGGREGLHEGRQSSLFFEQIRIIKEMREATNGEYPKFAVWENVPGAFSSNKGEDFRCVLESFAQIGGGAGVSIPRPENGKWCTAGEIVGDGYSVAWRELDAQYWGVPQRRKRIYLVADFAGERAGEILFEREDLRGHPASSGAPGQDAADDAARGTGGSRGVECLNPWDAQSIRQYAIDGVFPARTLTAEADASPCIDRGQNVVCYDARGNGDGEHCPTLTGDHENRVTDYTAVCVMAHGQSNAEITESISSTLNCNHEQPIAAYGVDCRNGALDAAKTHTLQAKASGGQSLNCTPCVPIDRHAIYTMHTGSFMTVEENTSPTIMARDYEDPNVVCYGGIGRDTFNQGQNAKFAPAFEAELQPDAGSKPPRKHIIRRLTPLECC